jgi:hypothetical protein
MNDDCKHCGHEKDDHWSKDGGIETYGQCWVSFDAGDPLTPFAMNSNCQCEGYEPIGETDERRAA